MKTYVTIPNAIRQTLGNEASDALAEEINRVLDSLDEALATRLVPKIELALDHRLTTLRGEMRNELHQTFKTTEASVSRCEGTLSELRKDFGGLKRDMVKWALGIIATVAFTLIMGLLTKR